MIGTKNYFDTIIANQQQLMATFTEYTNKAVEAMTPNKEVAEKGAALMNEMMTRPFELAGEMAKRETLEKFQADFWGTYSEHLNKSTELAADLYRKSFEYMKEMWGKYDLNTQQERARQWGEASQNVAKVYKNTLEANALATKEYMKF
ncbi:MAG: hypothetical protein IAE84_07555 [Saprospiraceae bacterium]|nr:hypothetical protein [Saprospiraceae bacterium]